MIIDAAIDDLGDELLLVLAKLAANPLAQKLIFTGHYSLARKMLRSDGFFRATSGEIAKVREAGRPLCELRESSSWTEGDGTKVELFQMAYE